MTVIDLEDNLLALALAIISEDFILPEHSWERLANPGKKHFTLTEEDIDGICKLRESGVSNVEVARTYGRDPSQTSRIYRKYKEERANEHIRKINEYTS